MIKDDEGRWIEDQKRIKDLFKSNFQNLYTKDLEIFAWCNTKHSFTGLNSHHKKFLEADLQPMEIKHAFFSMVAWKSLGPDGFQADFYQSTQNMTRNRFYRFIKSLWLKESSIAEIYFTDLCLIPKTSSPQMVTQFRHISLYNCGYKLFTKNTVNGMKPFINNLITPNQIGFIPKRNIHENIMVA